MVVPTVLVVDDSAWARVTFQQAWAAQGWRVAWARDGEEALARWTAEDPDLVTMDAEMPGLSGVETVRRLRAAGYRGPVVMVSSHRQADLTFEALAAGADDFVAKPAGREGVAAMVGRLSQAWGSPPRRPRAEAAPALPPDVPASVRLWCLVASTGGPRALQDLLSGAPRPPVPLLVVQHMPAGFTAAFSRRLSQVAGWEVREAPSDDRRQPLSAAPAWLAAGGRHLRVSRQAVWTEAGPRRHGVIPAADVTLADAVAAFGGHLGVVVLTGMGEDGAAGAQAAHALGAVVLAESPQTAVVWGMPGAVARAGAADAVLPRPKLREWLHQAWRMATAAGNS